MTSLLNRTCFSRRYNAVRWKLARNYDGNRRYITVTIYEVGILLMGKPLILANRRTAGFALGGKNSDVSGRGRAAPQQAAVCLVPRRLSFDENVRAKEGGKETTGETALRLFYFACRLYPSHGPLRFITSHSRLALASAMRKTKRLRRRLKQQ